MCRAGVGSGSDVSQRLRATKVGSQVLCQKVSKEWGAMQAPRWRASPPHLRELGSRMQRLKRGVTALGPVHCFCDTENEGENEGKSARAAVAHATRLAVPCVQMYLGVGDVD